MFKTLTAVFIFFFLLIHSIYTQTTTGILRGQILDEKNEHVVFAEIKVTQASTGTSYIMESDKEGFFVFNQLTPASDYTIQVRSLGYEKYEEPNLVIRLGEKNIITIQLVNITTELDGIEVIFDRSNPFHKPKRGNEVIITEEIINDLPTLNRSIQDLTRTLPEGNLNSFGGANYRFNNLSIDGSATNDVLGFQESASGAAGSTASGTPGGLAGTQPISFGALAAIAVKTAPFDVTYGNFTGASINAVTKGGTNKTQADVYSFVRNQSLIGSYAGREKQPNVPFYDIQTGSSLGGALQKDKLFYFVNFEYADRKEPVLNAPGTTSSEFPLSVIQSISDTLISRYGYDPGIFENAEIRQQSYKAFIRFDYNLSTKHKLSIKNNFVTGFKDYLDWTPNFFSFGNQGYRHNSTNNNTVFELRSILRNYISNKMTVSHSVVNDNRTYGGQVFPHLEITYNTANTIFAGTYREAAIYGLTLNTTQITDNLSIERGRHSYTIGATAEINDIQYRFLTAWNSRWQYNSVEAFMNNRPNRIRGVYNINNNDLEFNLNNPSADFTIILGGLYLQDDFQISDRLNITYGLRADIQYHPGKFPLSDEIRNDPFFSTYTNEINSKPQINPRTSFSFKFSNENLLLRGGSGLFTGRMPFVWYAYAHSTSGTNYFNYDARVVGAIPIPSDISSLQTIQSPQAEINLIDNNFNLPRDFKNNLALDVKLPQSTLLTLEATYSQVINGLYFLSINRKDSIGRFDGSDNREYFLATGRNIKINNAFTNVFLLTNTNRGYRYNLTASLTKRQGAYTGFLGYTYGESKDVNSTVRNSHAANFEWNQAISSNNPDLAYSNFDIRHKIVSYHFYEHTFERNQVKIGIIMNAQSGNPFSFVYEGDLNRDGSAKNDLIFIPASQDDISFTPITNGSGGIAKTTVEQWQALDRYISNNPYLKNNRGKYARRNGARTPWNFQLDLRFSYTRTLSNNQTIEIIFDIFNAANLINKNWGKQHFVPNIQNSGFSLIELVGMVDEKPLFQFNEPEGNPWLIDPLNSRWQAHIGIMYSFR